MAQVTLYVSDAVLSRLKADARRARKSLSAYVVDRLTNEAEESAWPPRFFELQGSFKGTLSAPEDPPPDEPDAL